MSNQHLQMTRIRHLISTWIAFIEVSNFESYFDINKAGEGLSRQLLNLIYDYKLEDLNKVKKNFHGLDIGDSAEALIAYQVTSRKDNKKILDNLDLVVKHKLNDVFTNGIKFLILNNNKVSIGGRSKRKPSDILPTFKMAEDIIYPKDLVEKIEEIYEKEADLMKFNSILTLLEKLLKPIFTTPPAQENIIAKGAIEDAFNKISENKESDLRISSAFLLSDLSLPPINPIAHRTALVEDLWNKLQNTQILWIQGSPSTGKTSTAILVLKLATSNTIWVECRDIKPDQLIEHIISLLSKHYNTPIKQTYQETLNDIFSKIDADVIIVINDLADISIEDQTAQSLSKLFLAASSKGMFLIVTSNYHLSSDFSDKYDLDITPISIPPFENEDTKSLLSNYGADDETADLFADIITSTTQGHPLLIQAAGRYLRDKGWTVDEDSITTIFSGKFGSQVEKEIYARVLENTTDEDTRHLLYRLSFVVGTFDMTTIARICSVTPEIKDPLEKASQLTGVWIQEISTGGFQLSPLIKRLSKNVNTETKKEIYKQLGLQIIEKKEISQIEALGAIFYFSSAEKYNQAAIVLHKTLAEFIRQPNLFFDWGFQLYWYSTPFPKGVAAFLKVQIRVLQIDFTSSLKKDTSFLMQDLQSIISNEDVGLLGLAFSNMLFFRLDLIADPLKGLKHLATAREQFEEIKIPEFDPGDSLFNTDLLNGVWHVFSQIHKKTEYIEWFNILRKMNIPPSIKDPYTNQMYRMAGVSIYRNAILKNRNTSENIGDLLNDLITLGHENDIPLISAYALKYLIKYQREDIKDLGSIAAFLEKHTALWGMNLLYKFLVFAEIGYQYFYSDNKEQSYFYLENIESIEIPSFYTETLDYMILLIQASHKKSPIRSAEIALKALDISLNTKEYVIEDKIKLYGEAAIGAANTGRLKHALDLYSDGYILLLDNFTDSEDQQATVIRYGNAVKYIDELIELGKSPSFGNGGHVIPEPGYFFRTNEKLLEGNYYFDERKFMGSTAVQAGYETINDLHKSKSWAYKSIELALDIKDPKYISILQLDICYLVLDRQYRQAYNLLEYIDTFHFNLKKRADSTEPMDDKLRSIMHDLILDDIGIYFSIILPITFSISLDIVYGRILKEQYQQLIRDVFNNDKYRLKDPVSYEFAKRLYEQILLHNVSYSQMQSLFDTYVGEYRDILYMIGCLLLCCFTSAKDAAYLQFAIISPLDFTMKKAEAAYRFCMIPYFREFWFQKVNTHPSEFSSKDHLRSKGWDLIDKTEWTKKVATIFRVIINHLDVIPHPVAAAFIDKI